MGGFEDFKLNSNKATCKDCTKRKLGCHGTCEDYLTFDKANKVLRAEKLRKIHEADAIYHNRLNRFTDMKSKGAKFRHGNKRGF